MRARIGAVVISMLTVLAWAGPAQAARNVSLTNVQATSPVPEGGATTLTGDVTTDCPGGTTLHVSWGDGHQEDFQGPSPSGPFTETHTYVDDDPSGTPSDTYSIQVGLLACDERTSAETSVVVNNVRPRFTSLSATTPVALGQSTTVSGAFADPGLDSFTLTITWGDGSSNQIQLDQAQTSFQLKHKFLDPGLFVVGVNVTDDDTGAATRSLKVRVLGPPRILTGPGKGSVPTMRAFDEIGQNVASKDVFSPGFTGGVRVAVGDVNGDSFPDVIVGAGPGGGPHVKVFSGENGNLLQSFFAFSPAFTGGVFVAAGDVDGDGFADVIVGADAGAGPHVKVFDLHDGSADASFFAFSPSFTGGVRVAAGDVTGDGNADIIVGAGAGGSPHVKVIDGTSNTVVFSFFAYSAGFTGGVFVGAGDVTGDGLADLITGAGAGGVPHVKVFDGKGFSLIESFFASSPSFTGGVRVAAGDVNGDGLDDIITGAGPGAGPHVRVFNGKDLTELASFFAYSPAFSGGVFVAGQPHVQKRGGV
ncbi:MAG TPA: VCBS repeat-containing protein [Actinomycetota bacterium]